MIFIQIELWPGGHRHIAKPLGHMIIANVGGTKSYGNYHATWYGRGAAPKRLGTCDIQGFRRLTHNVWYLLCLVLAAGLDSDKLLNSYDTRKVIPKQETSHGMAPRKKTGNRTTQTSTDRSSGTVANQKKNSPSGIRKR